ncbi:MAG: AsmA family protein, partial [Bacteroidota bacterium]
MKIVKKILMIVLLLLVLLVGAAIAIPYFFKDDILVALRETINKNVDATVDFEDINLSLLRSFPDFSLGIASYKITGRDAFEGIVLAEGESIDLTLDIWSVISSDQPIQLKSINVDAPRIHVVVTRNGKANYDIFGTSADTSGDSETTDFVIQLDEYRISDAHLIYDDRTLPAYVDIKSMNHEGTGNFTQDIYDLATATQIAAFTARYDGITYLNKAETNLNATVNIDNSRSRYTLKDNELTINDLTVSAEGWLELAGDDILMDLEFGTPENDFRSLFSLVPSAYIADYEDVDIKGQFELSGMAKGTYSSAREQYPAFGLDMNVTDGDVQYPELPLGISDIYTAMEIQHPGGNLNKMKIDIDNFRLNVGSNPISGRFKLRTPLSDPDMDARIKGKLDLTSLQQAFPVTDVEALSGIVQADVTVDARMSAVDSGNYQDVEMAGTANVQDVNYKGMGMPLVQVNSLAVDFSPTKVTIDNFNTKLGASDLRGSGQIDNVLAFFAKDKTMSGKFDLVSNYFNADEWLTTSESENPVIVDNTVETSTTTDEPFDNFV